METVGTKPPLRATDRLRQTVAALAKLLDQTMSDLQALDSELQERAVAETDEAAAIALDRQVSSAVERIRVEMKAQLEEERAKLAPEHLRVAEEAVEAEVARVEALIREVNNVIDNPDTELSVVIRKNAERAELESYLKGLRFRIADR